MEGLLGNSGDFAITCAAGLIMRTSYMTALAWPMAVCTAVSVGGSPAAARISVNAWITASVASCGSSSVTSSVSTEIFELVNVTPYGDVHPGPSDQRANLVNLTQRGAGDATSLPRARHVGDQSWTRILGQGVKWGLLR